MHVKILQKVRPVLWLCCVIASCVIARVWLRVCGCEGKLVTYLEVLIPDRTPATPESIDTGRPLGSITSLFRRQDLILESS